MDRGLTGYGGACVRALAAICLASSAGCCLFGEWNSWCYVSQMGGPGQITQWAIRQTDDDRIRDAIAALLDLSQRSNFSDAPLSTEAIADVELIYARLVAGWPNYTGANHYLDSGGEGRLSESQRSERREATVKYIYSSMTNLFSTDRARDAFARMRPDPDQFPARYRIWKRVADKAGIRDAQKADDSRGAKPPG